MQLSSKCFDHARSSTFPSIVSTCMSRTFSRTIFGYAFGSSSGPHLCKRYFSVSASPLATAKGSIRRASNRSQKLQRQKEKQKQHNSDNQQQQQQQQQDQEPTRSWHAAASAMIIPFVFAAYGISDWMFNNRTRGHNEGLRQEFLEEQHRRYENDNNGNNYLSSLETKPTLFHCVIRKNHGLVHCLPGVQLGDVVEILEEGVGPEHLYNLCRLPAKTVIENQEECDELPVIPRDSYGWFPIRWLQKLDHYESMARNQQRVNNLSTPDQQ